MTPLYPANSINPTPTVPTVINDLPFVSGGMDGARNYATRPSSRVAVFDKDDDIFYVISTDVSNNKTSIERKRFFDEPEPKPEDLFVSKQEFSELKGEIANVQQSLQQLINGLSTNGEVINDQSTNNGKHETDKPNVSGSSNKRRPSSIVNTNGRD